MGESGALPHEETLALIEQAQAGDAQAQERLVVCNAPLVRSIVRKYTSRGTEYEDLYQIGCLGLIKAIRNFNTTYNVRFSTYAVPMIAGEIKRFLRDDGMIKVSRSLKELAARAVAVQGELSARNGKEPGIVEIAQVLEQSPEDVALALESARPHISIYEPAFGDDSDPQVIDRMSDGGDGEEEALNRVLLKELLSILDARERRIILLRYFSDKTQSEIAALMGVSQVQISRIESRILKKLREKAQ